MLTQIILGIIGIVLGVVAVWKNRYIVDNLTGRNSWAERTFGGAGTYTMIKLLGILIIAISFLYMTGTLQEIILSIWNFIFGSPAK